MAIQLFADNAVTTLAAPITSSATSLTLTSGGGSLFPALVFNNWFIATLVHYNTGVSPPVVTAYEIIKVTGISADSFTSILRAQEGTSAQSWNAGDTVAMLVTAGGVQQGQQATQVQSQSYNWSLDTGVTANAYVVSLTPAMSAHVPYQPIACGTTRANTGAATFNDGAGALPIILPNGNALVGGEISPPVSGGTIFTVMYNGAGAFQLLSANFGSVAYINAQIAAAIAAAQSGVGAVIAAVMPSSVVVSTAYQTLLQFPVVSNATYKITFNGTCTGNSSAGNLATQVIPDEGTITAQNGGINFNINASTSVPAYRFGNLAGGGGGYPLSGWPLYQSVAQQLSLQGEFKTGSGAINYAYLQFLLSGGALTVGGGSFGEIVRLA